jgi:hypothetical protein
LSTRVATTAIVDSVPPEKQGVASAVNDSAREIGAALGIALSGSLLAAGYRHHMGPAIVHLPAMAQTYASSGFEGAVQVAAHKTTGRDSLISAARQAFIAGVHEAFGGVVIALSGITLALALVSPDRRGLTVVSRLRSRREQRTSACRAPDPRLCPESAVSAASDHAHGPILQRDRAVAPED